MLFTFLNASFPSAVLVVWKTMCGLCLSYLWDMVKLHIFFQLIEIVYLYQKGKKMMLSASKVKK